MTFLIQADEIISAISYRIEICRCIFQCYVFIAVKNLIARFLQTRWIHEHFA